MGRGEFRPGLKNELGLWHASEDVMEKTDKPRTKRRKMPGKTPKIDVPFQTWTQKRLIQDTAASRGLNAGTYLRSVGLRDAGYKASDDPEMQARQRGDYDLPEENLATPHVVHDPGAPPPAKREK